MTLLADDPRLWDLIFPRSTAQLRFAQRLRRRTGSQQILDVGCATGTLCGALASRDVRVTGVDINPRFIEAAKELHPQCRFVVGDMCDFRLRRRFDLLLCLGTTFCYNLHNEQIVTTLRNFRSHLRPGGMLAIDVLNAAALLGPRPFRSLGEHSFVVDGRPATARIRHTLQLKQQCLTEQVSWKFAGRPWRRDAAESLRLLFPQELAFYLECAGFEAVELTDGYERNSVEFGGRRLVAVARRPG